MTTLRTDFKDRYDVPYTPTLPEPHTITTVNDWGYGFFLNHIPSDTVTPVLTIDGTAATVVTTTPTAGQVKIWYADRAKTSFVECNSADNGKAVSVTDYRGQGSTYASAVVNAQNTQINVNTDAIADHETRIADLELNGTGGGVAPTVTLTPANGATGQLIGVDIVATFNKWLYDTDAPAGALVLYPTSADRAAGTNAVAGALTKSANGQLTFNPTSDLTNDSQYFGRLPAGLKFADGTSLTNDVDWAFVVGTVATHQAPTAPTLGTPTVGDTTASVAVTATSTFYDSATLSTYNWYKRINGQTPWVSDGTGASPHSFTGLANGSPGYDFCCEAVDSLGAVSAKSVVVSGVPFAAVNITDFTSQSAIIGSVSGGGGTITHGATETVATTGDTQYAYDYYKTPIDKAITRTYRVRFKVTAPTTNASHGPFSLYQTNSPSTIHTDFQSGTDLRRLQIDYANTVPPMARYTNTSGAVVEGTNIGTNLAVNTEYDYVLETTPTQVRIECRATGGTVLTTTGWINWTDIKDTGASLYLAWGDVLNWAWFSTIVVSQFQVS